MKQLTAPIKGILSANAYRKYEEYCKKKDWGTTLDGEFIEWAQLNIGQLLEFLKDNKNTSAIFLDLNGEPIDYLLILFKDILEETN